MKKFEIRLPIDLKKAHDYEPPDVLREELNNLEYAHTGNAQASVIRSWQGHLLGRIYRLSSGWLFYSKRNLHKPFLNLVKQQPASQPHPDSYFIWLGHHA